MKTLRPTKQMKARYFTMAFGLVAVAAASAAQPLPMPYTCYSVSIAAGPSRGSGFYLQASNSVYLVTARHVLFNDKQSPTNWPLWSAEAECTSHISESAPPTIMTIDLASLTKAKEVRYSTNHGVAIVRVEDCNSTNVALVHFLPGIGFRTSQTTLSPGPISAGKKYDDTPVGMDAFLFGFPSSLGLAEMPQIDPSLPLMRKGIVAGKNLKQRTLILDCPTYQGNSGGIVVGRETVDSTRGNYLFDVQFPILGIVVEFVPFSEAWLNARYGYANQTLSNSGYSVAEPIEIVTEMIWK